MRSPGSVLRARRRERRRSTRVSDRSRAFAHSRGNRAQNTRAHVRASGSARCTSHTSIPSESASGASVRLRARGAKRRASWTVQSTGGSGQSSPTRSNAWRSTRAVEARVVGDQHPPVEQLRQLRQHLVGRGRRVDHALRDSGEALDPSRQRPLDTHERVERLVQLPAANQHRTHLGQLAQVSAEPVGLGVDGQELRRREGTVEQNRSVRARFFSLLRRMHERPMEPPAPDGPQRPLRGEGAKPSSPPLSLAMMPRPATVFACSACGHESPKWHGRCPGCGEWNTLVEETRAAAPARRGRARRRHFVPSRSARSRRPGSNGCGPASGSSIACSAAASSRAAWC